MTRPRESIASLPSTIASARVRHGLALCGQVSGQAGAALPSFDLRRAAIPERQTARR